VIDYRSSDMTVSFVADKTLTASSRRVMNSISLVSFGFRLRDEQLESSGQPHPSVAMVIL
jgi:hypothetical protein